MPVVTVDTYAPLGGPSLELSIQVQGNKLLVEEGTICLKGQTLAVEAEEFLLTVRSEKATVEGYLVKTPEGEVRVLVDEVEHDGEDRPLDFADLPGYQLLSRLFLVDVPGGATTFEGLSVMVWRILAVEAMP